MEQHPTFEGGQDIRDRSFEYACQVVDFCQQLSESGGVANELIAIVTTIVKHKRRNVAAKKAAAKAAKATGRLS